MKPTHTLRSFLISSIVVASSPLLHANPYYWDSDDTTPGFGNTTGTWGTSAFWSTDAAGTSATANSTITTADTVNFGTATLNYANATVTGPATAQGFLNMNFGLGQTTALTLSGGNLDLAAASAIAQNSASTMTINSVLQGSGSSLTKAGTGTLTLSGTNTYNGITYINEGTLRIGNAAALGAQTGTSDGTIIASGATLDLGGIGSGTLNQAGSVGTERITASGAGVGGNGAIVSSTAIPSNFIGLRHLTLAGNTTLGFTSRWDVGSNNAGLASSLVGAGHTLSIVGSGSGQASFNNLGATDLGDIDINIGSGASNIVFLQGNTTLGRAANTVTIRGGSTLQITGGGNAIYDKKFALDTGKITVEKTGGVSLPGTISLTGASNIITANTSAVAITASGVISGTGALTKAGAGSLTLSNENTYTGGTTVSAGVLNLTNTNTFGAGSITVGNVSGKAVLNLSGSANVSIGGGVGTGQTQIGTANGANAALNISAGTFASSTTANQDSNFNIGSATGAYGYLGISGVSTSVTAHRWQIGGGFTGTGTGVALISGGTSKTSGSICLWDVTTALLHRSPSLAVRPL